MKDNFRTLSISSFTVIPNVLLFKYRGAFTSYKKLFYFSNKNENFITQTEFTNKKPQKFKNICIVDDMIDLISFTVF